VIDLSQLRVLIVHDWLVAWAGAERCVEQMLEVFPQADLVVGILATHMRDHNAVTRRARETWLGRVPGARGAHRWMLPLEGVAFRTLSTDGYDLVVSSSHAFAKMVRAPAGGRHISYCYTPPRYLWDLYEQHKRGARVLERLALVAGAASLRQWDLHSARRVDQFITISQCVADRVRRWYGRESRVVHPPVIPKPTAVGASHRSNFLLTLGRLVPYKRVDLAIRAAEVVGMRLVVAGDGPERERLKQIAGPQTTFLGAISEEEAGKLLETCAMFVFCAEEDFGIAPLEANAHGAPVVAYGRGGASETLVAGATAEFFEEQTVEAVAAAIRRAATRSWDEATIRSNARRFAPAQFQYAFREVVASYLETGGWRPRPRPVT
jgi:glycosyltransferase involved in cell wall biosynthesis